MAGARLLSLCEVFGSGVLERVQASRVLIVGAGGIGCEVVKDLVLTGFTTLDLVDLDTIEVSNLNRQFLFQRCHVGRSKALVAREAALRFNSSAVIQAYHANIKDPRFGVEFFRGFTIVLNALDNLDARRHVNRMCLAADVPLVESGTSGFLGQVTIIKRGVTECYECRPKPTPKTFAVCTIRSNPTLLVHCVVWSKMVFDRLFGHPIRGTDENGEDEDGDDILGSEALEARGEEESRGERLFRLLFYEQIHKLTGMEEMWKGRSPPQPIDLRAVPRTSSHDGPPKRLQVWTLSENIEAFLSCFEKLSHLASTHGRLEFNKDDDLAMDFVSAATNLRAHIFGIKQESPFDTKATAGNIIPAIATTNAIVAGVMVLEALKIVKGELQACRTTYVLEKPASRGKILMPTPLEKPSSKCYVCSPSHIEVRLDTSRVRLGWFVDTILKGCLSMVEPTIQVGDAIIYEGGEDEDDVDVTLRALQVRKTLQEVRVVDSTSIEVDDYRQEFKLKLMIRHTTELNGDSVGFEIVDHTPQPVLVAAADASTQANKDEDEDDVVTLVRRKRKRPLEQNGVKRPKTNVDVICVD